MIMLVQWNARRWAARAVVVAAASAIVVPTGAAAQQDNPLHKAIGASDDLVIRASFRSRTEAIGGQFRPTGAKDDQLESFRTDVFAEYDSGPIRIGGELRDARGYGERRRSSVGVSDINALEPIQAYVGVDLDQFTGKGSSGMLQAGRFTMELGAGRLVGRPDFPNSVNTFTGVMLDWHSKAKDRVTLFWTMPSTRLPSDTDALHDNSVEWDRARGSVQFFGGDVTKTGVVAGVSVEGYLLRLAERDSDGQETRNRHLVTYGGRVVRAPAVDKFDFEVEAAGQSGHARATTARTDRTDIPVDAQFVHGEIGRRFAGGWAPRLSLHADYASGDNADPNHLTRFDTLYGATRVDFGPTGLYGALTRSNLVSGGVRVEVTPSKRLDAFIMARDLWLADATDSFAATAIRDRTGRSGRHAGEQVEARVRYWLVPKTLRVEGGGAVLAKGDFLRHAPNVQDREGTRYGYLDLTAEF
jgi:hypothetical protein